MDSCERHGLLARDSGLPDDRDPLKGQSLESDPPYPLDLVSLALYVMDRDEQFSAHA
jgi:hypothetical protein